jgi:hypothetical protein
MGMSQINRVVLSNPKSIKLSSTESLNVVVQVDEFRVNNFTDFSQDSVSICSLSEDKLVIAWESSIQDGNGYGVYTTIVDASTGMNLTREFRINHHTIGYQQYPEVCALSEDSFAVTWLSANQDPDGSTGVYATVVNATTGTNSTKEVRVNDYINDTQWSQDICALSNNKFVIVWQSEGQDLNNSYGIYAKVFDATTGMNLTGEFQINNPLDYDQKSPSICALGRDKFAVAWSSANQDPDGSTGVYATVVNATTGNNVTAEFRANYYFNNSQAVPSICSLSEDILAITWSGDEIGPSTDYDIFARIFNASTGANITTEFRVNHYYNDIQWYSSISALTEDSLIITWESSIQDGDGYGVYATVFDASTGMNITAEFRVNNYTDGSQRLPSIASLSEDRVAIAWQSREKTGLSLDIYSRVFFLNSAPEISNPSPYDGQSEVDLNTILEIDISDANGQNLTVYFYDNSSGTPNLLETDSIQDGGASKASFNWNGLSFDTLYRWFVKVSDGLVNTTSDEWQFNTETNSPPSINAESPSNGATNIGLYPELRINVSDANGQDLTIRFYDNSSGTPFALGFETISSSESEVVSLTWSDLDYNTEYKWYVVVSDGLVSTTSAQFSFITKEEDIIIPSFLPMIFLPLTVMTVLIAGIYISRKKTKDA